MSTHPRRDELIAAAATGHLDPTDEAELAALRRLDPDVDREIAELREVSDRLGALDGWVEHDAVTEERREGGPAVGARADAGPRRRRLARPVAAAAALVLVGAGLGVAGTLAAQSLDDDGGEAPSAAVEGPPGTLGAVEPVALRTSAGLDDAEVRVQVVAHTWGTEAVLDIHGLPTGERYEVQFVDRRDNVVSAGAFLGSTVPIHCSLNAALLREDATALRIVEAGAGVIGSAELPRVGA